MWTFRVFPQLQKTSTGAAQSPTGQSQEGTAEGGEGVKMNDKWLFSVKKVGSLLLVELKPLLTIRSGLIPQMSQCDLQDEDKFSRIHWLTPVNVPVWPNLNKLTPLLWKRKLLYWFYVACNNETFLSLHVKCLIFCPVLTKYGRARQIFVQVLSIKFHVKRPLEDSLKHAERQTDGHDESNWCYLRLYESACRGVALTTHRFVASSLKKE